MGTSFALNHIKMNIDFLRFDTLDKTEVTLLAYKLTGAIAEDMSKQGRSFKIAPYGENIAEVYPLRNRAALKRGQVIGRKIAENQQLNTGDSLIRGSDLAKIVSYILINDGLHQWSGVRALLKSSGGAYADLEKDLPSDPKAVLANMANNEASKIGIDTLSASADLIRLAKIIEPMERTLVSQSVEIERQGLTILNISNRNTDLAKEIFSLQSVLSELLDRIESEENLEKVPEMIKKYREFKQKLDLDLE